MKKISCLFGVLATLFLFSCEKKSEVISEKSNTKKYSYQKTAASVISPISRIALSNELIDLDISSVSEGRSFPVKDLYYAKAAVYRFYKNVKLEDGQYICSLKSEKEINISLALYNMFINNLSTLNAEIKKQKAAGVKVQLFEISDNYLISLIK